jgi:murein DD-endopeptidase MepM/ murein hydrolase activator NlpD
VDLGATTPEVLAAGAGTITFAGQIAGRGVVVVRHDDGLRTTYEPVTPDVAAGQVVTRGTPIGTVQAGVPHCALGPCLHWGALAADRYLDPLTLLRPDRRPPPVLLPLGDTSR